MRHGDFGRDLGAARNRQGPVAGATVATWPGAGLSLPEHLPRRFLSGGFGGGRRLRDAGKDVACVRLDLGCRSTCSCGR